MKQILDQLVQFLQQGIEAIFRFIEAVWTWSIGEIGRIMQVPWQSWPIWKQVVLVLVAAGVIWALFKAAKELWEAAEHVLAAFATLLAVMIKTLPHVVLAGIIALSGIWVVNNVDPSSFRLPAGWQVGSR